MNEDLISKDHRVTELPRFPRWIMVMWVIAVCFLVGYCAYNLLNSPSLMTFTP